MSKKEIGIGSVPFCRIFTFGSRLKLPFIKKKHVNEKVFSLTECTLFGVNPIFDIKIIIYHNNIDV